MFGDYFKKIKSRFGQPIFVNKKLGFLIDMRRDWKILCGVFCLLIVLILLADISAFYNNFGSDGMFGNRPYSSVNFDKTALSKTLDKMKAKETLYNSLLKEKTSIVDPSL